MKDYLEASLALLTIVAGFAGVIWRLAQIKQDIEDKIENSYDQLADKIRNVDKDLTEDVRTVKYEFDIHKTKWDGKEELIEYRLNGLDEVIHHKFDRCWGEIKQLQKFLAKDGFVPRDSNKATD